MNEIGNINLGLGVLYPL